MYPISVIVSTYKRLDYLEKALLSIESQSIVPSEVVVTDDGSGESVIDCLRSISPRFDFRIKLVMQKDMGFRLARCKNNGIRLATNEFLVFWDQDIVGTKRYLEVFWSNSRRGRFVVSYPIRLSRDQTELISEETIRRGTFADLLTDEQIAQIQRQYRKDKFYYYMRKIFPHSYRYPKLRGGVFGIFKDDIFRVNGFDEQYQGWGNEDDDLGRRLYAIGIAGYNPFCDEFPLHLYHPPYHQDGMRVNLEYHRRREKEIRRGKVRPVFGLDNPSGDDEPEVVEF